MPSKENLEIIKDREGKVEGKKWQLWRYKLRDRNPREHRASSLYKSIHLMEQFTTLLHLAS